MNRFTIILALVLAVALTLPAVAEVEEITVGGDIKIRGQIQTPGPSYYDGALWFDDENANVDWITQRTRLNVDASLSGGVRGFIELQAFDFWGWDDEGNEEAWALDWLVEFYPDDFEMYAGQGNPYVELYQAYIEMNDIADYPLRVRIGRQEMTYGREWLVGNNDAGLNFSGLAFDALRLTYDTDMLTVDLWASKLADFSSPMVKWWGPTEEDADWDFHGLYATYKGVENMELDGYLLYVRDAYGQDNFLFGSNTDKNLNLYTAGARLAGCMELDGAMLDYNLEAAYQFGDDNIPDAQGDSGDYQGWAANALVGMTLTDVDLSPRFEAEYAFFSGADDVLGDNDMDMFLRLFSDVHYGELNLGQNLDAKATNLHIARLGASIKPCEKSKVSANLYRFWLAEDKAQGWGTTFGVPQGAPGDPNEEVGWELDLIVNYQYTEDLLLTAGWAHFFPDDAIEQSWGYDGVETNDDEVDYIYVDAQLTF